MIMAGAGAILGTLGRLYGDYKSGQERRKAQDALSSWYNNTSATLNGQLASDYTSRGDFQNIFQKQRNLLAESYKRARAVNAVAGGSDSSLAMMQNNANNAVAETMGAVASQADNFKNGVQNQLLNANQQYAQGMQNIHNQSANQMAQSASDVVKAGGAMVASDDSLAKWLTGLGKKRGQAEV